MARTESTSWQPPRVLGRYGALTELDGLLTQLQPNWLSQREQSELAQWHDETRRRGWLLSRILGKRLIVEASLAELHRIEILSRDADGRVNRPCLWSDGTALRWSLSISHSERGVLVALAATDGATIGVDLTPEQSFSQRIADLWFTPAEQAWHRAANSRRIGAYIWAAKEALYKAVSDGESFVPRDFEILADGACRYRGVPLADCQLQSWTIDGHLAVLTVVRSARPTELPLSKSNIR